MEPEKQAAFVRKMRKKRLGLTKRQNFDGGGLAGLIGSSGGVGGTGFNTPSGTNAEQINNAYNRNQSALDAQNAVAGVLAPQAGTAVANQNTLAGQYAAQAAGQGPNVAQTMLNQRTGQNVATQASLMSGQRGASANPALLARQAAQQGAATQQQGVGEAATMQAQQQIAAQQAQAQLAANQIAQTQGATSAATQAAQGEQGILQGANTANNNLQGQFANTTMQGQQGLLGGVMNGVGAAFGLDEGGEVGSKKLEFIHKMAKMGMDHFHGPNPKKMADGGLSVPTVGYQAPQVNFQQSPAAQGGFSSGANAGAEAMGSSMKGSDEDTGSSNKSDKKQSPEDVISSQNASMMSGPSQMDYNNQGDLSMRNANMMGGASDIAAPTFGGFGVGSVPGMAIPFSNGGKIPPQFQGPHQSHIANYLMNKGGKIPALVSPGEIYLNPEQVEQVVQNDVDPAKIGKKYGGKAKVKGDSKKNDIIPDDLDDGGVVIDRDHVMSPEKRKLFVHKSIAKKRVGSR
jgi:hypothetical protein